MDKLIQKPRDVNLSGRISEIRWILKLHRNFKDSGKSLDLLNHKNHNVIFNDMVKTFVHFEDDSLRKPGM